MSWESITLPTSEGGLGIKRLEDWNKSLILHHLWQVIQPLPLSFWASWIHSNVIKNKNFWTINIPNDCSWIWKKVLKLRPLDREFIIYKIGNGASTSLWFDPWLNRTPIAMHPHALLIIHSRISPQAKVQAILTDNGWMLPQSNHSIVRQFRCI